MFCNKIELINYSVLSAPLNIKRPRVTSSLQNLFSMKPEVKIHSGKKLHLIHLSSQSTDFGLGKEGEKFISSENYML